MPAEPIDGMRDGVVSLPHGWGHDLPDVAMDVARKAGGVSANSLTDHRVVETFSGTAVFNGVPVELSVG